MRCPTCGRAVAKQQEVCSFCGALIRPASEAFNEAGPEPSGEITPENQPGPPTSEISPQAPVFESVEAASEEVPPAREFPLPAPRSRRPAPRSPVPSLFRLLVVLAFFLVPLFNFLLRNSHFSQRSSPQPVLREAIFCENVVQGLPRNPKAVFSLRRDQQIVLYSRWSGSRESHALSLQWITPQGTLHVSPVAMMRYEVGRAGFSASSFLPLQPGMPLGNWKVEVLLDRKLRATLNFQLRE